MKKRSFYILLFIVIGLGACHKETSIERDSGQAADMVATIGAQSWEAADSTQTAIFTNGLAIISGTSVDGQEISITLNDTVVGLYTLNQSSPSLAVYANLDSVGSYAYSTNQGADTSQAGGTVNVISVDPVRRIISGIFSFKAYRNQDNSQVTVTQGVFYNIPYVDQ